MKLEEKKYCDDLIASVISSIESKEGKKYLSSIILTGSFGRDEPTIECIDGKIHLKSDVEIALIVNNSPKQVENIIAQVTREFEEDLNLMPIDEKRVKMAYNFNYSFFVPKHKTIFTFDLFNGSRTIWGTDFIGKKKITLDMVDVYEAKRLVGNRIGELAYLQENTTEQKDKIRIHWKGKLILAIVSAWLICEKKYVSSYHGQFDIVKNNIGSIEKTFGNQFFFDYEKVFIFLRDNGEEYEVSDSALRNYVSCVDQYLKERRVCSPKVNSFSRILKYLIKYLKTGRPYGVLHFENKIIQDLISSYSNSNPKINEVANIWHRVLY